MTANELIKYFQAMFDIGEITDFNKNRFLAAIEKFRRANSAIEYIAIEANRIEDVKILSMAEIMEMVCRKHRLTAEQIKRDSPIETYLPHKRKSQVYVNARYDFISYCRKYGNNYTFHQIAEYLGYKGAQKHSSVIHFMNTYKFCNPIPLKKVI